MTKKAFGMPAPCGNCPFLKVGAIPLRPGRLAGIMRTLRDQNIRFPCHKTASGEEWENDDGESGYVCGPDDLECAGAMLWRLKTTGPSQMMRIAGRLGMLDYDALEKHAHLIVDAAPRSRRTR